MSYRAIQAALALVCLWSASHPQSVARHPSAAPAPVRHQRVWIVEGTQGLLLLQEAVDAASSGDVILLRTDAFSLQGGLRIEGKGITIVGEGPRRLRALRVT